MEKPNKLNKNKISKNAQELGISLDMSKPLPPILGGEVEETEENKVEAEEKSKELLKESISTEEDISYNKIYLKLYNINRNYIEISISCEDLAELIYPGVGGGKLRVAEWLKKLIDREEA